MLGLFRSVGRHRERAAWALLTLGFVALAFVPLLDTYDNYRTLISYADGTLTRRQVEAEYSHDLVLSHPLVDHVRSSSDEDDTIYVWGFWPIVHFWADRPLATRFVVNNGLRATWAPESWRSELMEDLIAAPPRFFAVARGDDQPWLSGTTETSDEHIQDSFPELRRFLEERYVPIQDMGLFVLYERSPALVENGRTSR